MTSNASTVGAVQFPVPEGAQDSALRDPVCEVLLAYLAHWLNYGLDAKLGNMRPTNVAGGLSVVPRGARFDYDPGTTFVRNPLPALYCWYGRETRKQWTMVKWLRVATYHVRWYFAPLTVPKGRGLRSGLQSNVARLLHRAADELRHDTFPTVDDVLPVTLPVCGSIEAALCAQSIKLENVTHGVTWESPGEELSRGDEQIQSNLGMGTDGAVQRGFPTVHSVWTVSEFVEGNQADEGDETPDGLLEIEASENGPAIPFMDRNLNAPDGTDDPSQKGP
jgi:hypothetical protein